MNNAPKVNSEVKCAEDACRLRDRMDRIRRQMDREVTGLRKGASNLLDVRYQVTRHPLIGVAIATALGYFVMPSGSKPEKARLDDESIDKIIERGGIRVDSNSKPPSLMSSGIKLAANALLRAGIAYAGQQLGKASGHAAAKS